MADGHTGAAEDERSDQPLPFPPLLAGPFAVSSSSSSSSRALPGATHLTGDSSLSQTVASRHSSPPPMRVIEDQTQSASTLSFQSPKRAAVGTFLAFKTLQRSDQQHPQLSRREQFPTSVSNFAHMADGHHLVSEPVAPTADGLHETHAHSSTAVVIQQDTDGAHALNTRPPTPLEHNTREPREMSPAPSVQSERATLPNSVVRTGPDIAQILECCFKKQAHVDEERNKRNEERRRRDQESIRAEIELRQCLDKACALRREEAKRCIEEARVQCEKRQLVELRRVDEKRARCEEERRRVDEERHRKELEERRQAD